MNNCGVYRVLGSRDYRGHKPDTVFTARLEPRAEHRAVMRGSIEKIGEVVLKPEHPTFPEGWLQPAHVGNGGPETGLSH